MKEKDSSEGYGRILTVYCLGLLIGGLYVGIAAPVRTVVQEQFGLDDSTGIWMINIYTLFYAALIPVIGKIADRYGRNQVFGICILVFMIGAALCGLSSHMGGYGLLLLGRVVQAAGAGGMIPVATAEIGTSFPEEKRGFALGVAAGVTGLANVLGAGVGSAVVGIAGQENWSVLFFAAIPVCLMIFIGARLLLQGSAKAVPGKMDLAGSILLILLVLSLLIGLKELDLFHPADSLAKAGTWGPLAGFLLLLILFYVVEKRAEDPVFHLEFFRNRPIVITLIVSLLIGCVIVAMMLIPEYAEVIMDAPTGSGGYYMLIIGVASMVGPPIGGKLIDRFGPKRVLICGMAIMIAGYCYLAFFVSVDPSAPALTAGLALVGLGMGLAMGAPTNYMILDNTSEDESTSAIATITLVRQMGTTIAPAIYVGFLSGGAGSGSAGSGAGSAGGAGETGGAGVALSSASLGVVAGYQHMLLCVACFALAVIIVMLFYRDSKGRDSGRQ